MTNALPESERMGSQGQPEQEWKRVLRRKFGLSALRPGQEQVIRCLMAGRSALALFPTGAGKSLCYQLPAVLLDGLTLVVSPLIALMKDQVEGLLQRGVAAARLDSSQEEAEQARVWRELEAGAVRLLYVAPERLMTEAFKARLRPLRPVMMAVDEAHCISEWGHSFRPDYLRLAAAARELNLTRIVALTATATPRVAEDIRVGFGIAAEDVVRTSFLRPNLHYRVTPCRASQRFEVLMRRLRSRAGAAVVYVTLQQTAEEVATRLQRAGVNARAYHAGMSPEHRTEAQEAFMRGEARVVVATMAFGMGIDKADVRAVYHYNLPKTIENYQQESGRAGRDGKKAHGEVLACRDDLVSLGNFVHGDTPSEGTLRQLLDHMLRRGRVSEVSIYDLSVALDLKPVVIETALACLETAGVIRACGQRYAARRIRLIGGEKAALAGRGSRERRMLEFVFGLREEGRQWITVDLDQAALSLKVDAGALEELLEALESCGEAVVKRAGMRAVYECVEREDSSQVRGIQRRLVESFVAREQREEQRLAQVMSFVSHPGCLTQWLLKYFGEEMSAPCGKCESCSKAITEPREIPGEKVMPVLPKELERIQQVLREGHAVLRQGRSLARFLCGLSSPGLQRAGLSRHSEFGLLKRLPFREVLDQAEAML